MGSKGPLWIPDGVPGIPEESLWVLEELFLVIEGDLQVQKESVFEGVLRVLEGAVGEQTLSWCPLSSREVDCLSVSSVLNHT